MPGKDDEQYDKDVVKIENYLKKRKQPATVDEIVRGVRISISRVRRITSLEQRRWRRSGGPGGPMPYKYAINPGFTKKE